MFTRLMTCDGGIEPHVPKCGIGVLCGLIEVDFCMRFASFETHLTHKLGWFEHFNRPDTALSYFARYMASYVLC
jgi:hypothetical protein